MTGHWARPGPTVAGYACGACVVRHGPAGAGRMARQAGPSGDQGSAATGGPPRSAPRCPPLGARTRGELGVWGGRVEASEHAVGVVGRARRGVGAPDPTELSPRSPATPPHRNALATTTPPGATTPTAQRSPRHTGKTTTTAPPRAAADHPTEAPPPAAADHPTKAPPPAAADHPTKAPPPGAADHPTKAPPPGAADYPTKARARIAGRVRPASMAARRAAATGGGQRGRSARDPAGG